jgi:hypothetical protein
MWRNITVSDINFISINENFPVAGEDNDTQVFRDNFDSIKAALSTAKTEITDLQDNSARTDQDSNFNYNILSSVTLQDTYLKKKNYGSNITATEQEISYKEASYHIIKFASDCSLSLIEFPTANTFPGEISQLSKLTLELYGDGTKRKLSFATSGTTVKKKNGFPQLTESGNHDLEVTALTNPVIVEVWQHSNDIIFLKYVGNFS